MTVVLIVLLGLLRHTSPSLPLPALMHNSSLPDAYDLTLHRPLPLYHTLAPRALTVSPILSAHPPSARAP